MVFVHFPLFYFSLFLWLLFFLYLLTKEDIKKISRVLIYGMWLIVIPPFFDIIISKGSGYKLTYLRGIEQFFELHKFFDFTKDLIESSWGQRIEILLAILGGFGYVFIKTKKFLKAFFLSLIFYLVIFIHGVLPNTIASIPGYLGYDGLKPFTLLSGGIAQIDSQNYSLVFLLSSIIVGLLILKKSDREFFYRIINLRLSILLITGTLIGIIYGIWQLRALSPFLLINPFTYLLSCLILLSIHLININREFNKSSFRFALLIITPFFISISISLVFFVIILISLIFTNITEKAITGDNIRKGFLRTVCKLIVFLFSFLAGFSGIFQNYTILSILPINPKKVNEYVVRTHAWNLFLDKRYNEALKDYQRLYQLNKDAEIKKLLGQCYLYTGEIDKGIECLEAIPKLNYEVVLALGDAYTTKGKFIKAESIYYQAIRENIEPTDFLIKLAELFARQGRRDEMERVLNQGKKFGMPVYKFYQIRADFFLSQKDLTNAQKNYERSLNYNPRSVSAHSGLGTVYYYKKDYDRAEREFLTALKFEPKNHGLYNNLGAIYFVKGDYEKAQEAFERSLKINPSQAEAYYNLGLIFEKYGEIEEAVKMHKKALAIRPGFSPAIDALKRMGRIE